MFFHILSLMLQIRWRAEHAVQRPQLWTETAVSCSQRTSAGCCWLMGSQANSCRLQKLTVRKDLAYTNHYYLFWRTKQKQEARWWQKGACWDVTLDSSEPQSWTQCRTIQICYFWSKICTWSLWNICSLLNLLVMLNSILKLSAWVTLFVPLFIYTMNEIELF